MDYKYFFLHGTSLYLLGIMLSSFCWAQENYTFGIVPQQSASKTAAQWIPVLNYLEQETGFKFHFKTAKNIPTFEDQLKLKKYDLAYMNPYHYIIFHDTSDYLAIAKAKDIFIRGIIVTRKDNALNKLRDLSNKRIAFPSPNAFAASMLNQAELEKNNIKFTPAYVSSHDSVYRNVHQKRVIAGGGVERTFQNMDKEITDQLKILYKTSKYTPHAIAANRRVPNEHRKKIVKAFEKMSSYPETQKLLKQIKINAIAEARNSDWDDVRQLYSGNK